MENHFQITWIQLLLSVSRYIDALVCQTSRHSAKVAQWVTSIAYTLDINGKYLEAMYWAALLHDVGKVGVPGHILSKNGPLTKDEWVVMKLHPAIGANMVKSLQVLTETAPFIYAHQEKFDGSGYPEGLKGEEIPLGARILTVADAYEAMTTDRAYRPALSQEEAIGELRTKGGEQFDPDIVETFLEIMEQTDSLERVA